MPCDQGIVKQYSSTVHVGLGISGQKYYPKTKLTIPTWHLDRVQKCFQYNLDRFQNVSMKFLKCVYLVKFSTAWLTD